MSLANRERLIAVGPADVLRAIESQKANKINSYYPDTGPLRRELYPKHCAVFAAGKEYRTRAVVAGNRTGKSEGIGCYETVLHLTGLYPHWWEGHRFKQPIKGWAAGDTSKTCKEILQEKLLGPFGAFGTGMIPKDCLVRHTMKAGLADAIDTIYVKHVSGGVSMLGLKSYDQKRLSFQGSEQHWILLDEEPDESIMTECSMRTMATGGFEGGKMLLTFTPVNGWTDIVDQFVNDDRREAAHRFMMQLSWEDAPHLSAAEREDQLREIPEYQRKARIYGIPELGEGAVYPFQDSDIVCEPFPIPEHWTRVVGLDVGARTAAVWLAHDRDSDMVYVTAEYYREAAEPGVHAEAIKSMSGGTWIPVYCDPAANQSSQIDGRKLLQIYREYGLDVRKADNAVEAGIARTFNRLSSGRLKIFRSCQGWLEERRKYRRKDGVIVKSKDHRLDAQRYAQMSDMNNWVSKLVPIKKKQREPFAVLAGGRGRAVNVWMAN